MCCRVQVFLHHGNFLDAIMSFSKARIIFQLTNGPSHEDVGQTSLALASIFSHLGRYPDAQALCCEGIRIYKAARGPRSVEAALALNDMGSILFEQRRFPQALDHFLKALGILDPDNPAVTQRQGGAAQHAPDPAHAASSPLPGAQTRGTDAPVVVPADHGLVATGPLEGPLLPDGAAEHQHHRQEEVALAAAAAGGGGGTSSSLLSLERQQAAAGAPRAGAGGSIERTDALQIKVVRNLVNTLVELGRVDDALNACEAAFRTLRLPASSGQGEELGYTLQCVGSIQAARGMLAEATANFEVALSISRRMHGEKHPAVAAALDRCGEALGRRGRWDEALALHKKALTIRRRMFAGNRHPHVARSMRLIGEVCAKQGRFPEALSMFRQGIAVHRNTVGADSEGEAAVLCCAARVKAESGARDEAVDSAREAERVYAKLGMAGKASEAADLVREIEGMPEAESSTSREEPRLS